MRAPPPQCKSARTWLRQKFGTAAFGMFTGQDSAAFSVFIHAVELYLYGDLSGRQGALAAMRGALLGMQPKCHVLCKEVIPAIGDWGHVEEIWPQIGGSK